MKAYGGFLRGIILLVFYPMLVFAHPTNDIQPDVVFVTTPHEVVAEILRLADVQRSDLLYDLGSGDGRIVITAARNRGARGVGIDIDPKLVELSRRNAEEAGVADRVRFIQQDLFQADFSAASVVTLYLLPDLNIRLRPLLFQQLQPGARVVSHAFHMEDWKPDEESAIRGSDIYMWVIPANVSGRWEWHADEQGLHQLHLEQSFQQIQGYLRNDAGFFPISWAVVRGDHLLILFDEGMDGSTRPAVLEGKTSGESLHGTLTRSDTETQTWQARREAGSQRPLQAGW